jgi:hypothetical protein
MRLSSRPIAEEPVILRVHRNDAVAAMTLASWSASRIGAQSAVSMPTL